MMRSVFTALCVSVLLLVTGCASQRPMPFKEATEKVEDKKAIYLLMVTMENKYKPSFHPQLVSVIVDRKEGDKWEGAGYVADMTGVVVVPGAAMNSYAARMELEPGEYRLRVLHGTGTAFPIIGQFIVPMYAPLSVREPRGLFYLGNVRATVREAKEGEVKAGGAIPVLDQAISGASGGTFDVVIADAWRTDEAVFRRQFPVLGSLPVRKAVLPAWDRARVAQEHSK